MSRFNNLEFNDRRQESGAARHESVKDGSHYLGEAEGAFRRGRFEQALRGYAKVLEYNPACVAAWTGQVRMLIELGEYREASLWADKAIERFPEEAELLAAKAVALARLGETSSALALSDAAVAARGDTAYIWLARGDVLMARGERRAESCFERALGMATDWLVAWLVSRIHHHYGKWAAALKYAQRAVDQGAAHAACWVQIGRCQSALGLIGPAQTAFEQARQLDPDCPNAERGLHSLTHVGWLARATGCLRQWLSR